MLTTLLGAKLGAALAAGAVGFSGVAVAAAAGVLPDAAQDFAHNAVGFAPAAHPDKSAKDVKTTKTTKANKTTKATPVGPDATGPAAFGLCTAWSHAKDSGKAAEKSIAFRNLATTAGGEAKIAAYCAPILAAKGPDTAGKPDVTGKPDTTGKPSTTGKRSTAGKSGVTPGTVPSRP